MPYRRIDAKHIIATADILAQRVRERFPDAGLGKVAHELAALGRDVASDAADIARPYWGLRAAIAAFVGFAAVILFLFSRDISLAGSKITAADLVQVAEASINTVLLCLAGLYTLVRLEERFKRKRVLGGLHSLRSLIHVIDMHQLTKDPALLTTTLKPTSASPSRTLGPDELARYLDYCSEMLALTGKLAALYAQSFNDIGIASAVNDIENLGSNLSRKIWQKITMIDARLIKSRKNG